MHRDSYDANAESPAHSIGISALTSGTITQRVARKDEMRVSDTYLPALLVVSGRILARWLSDIIRSILVANSHQH